ncbi:hypothetical protein [Corynebacterium mayonis]|uniref:hypothetical protein n=1 Tax=Corynebacterium mayonis TaxID=3062461 RepID=UPI00314031F4
MAFLLAQVMAIGVVCLPPTAQAQVISGDNVDASSSRSALFPLNVEANKLRFGNSVGGMEAAGAAVLLSLLGAIATLAALAGNRGDLAGFRRGSSGSSSGGGQPSEAMGEREFQAPNGERYTVNPQARSVSTQDALKLFDGADDIGTSRTLSVDDLRLLKLRPGDVLSIPPSEKFEAGALALISDISLNGNSAAVRTHKANLEDLLLTTTGFVYFDAVALDGDENDFDSSAPTSSEWTRKIKLDLNPLFEAETAAQPLKVGLSGEETFSAQLGLNRAKGANEADKSFILSHDYSLSLEAQATKGLKPAEAVNERIAEMLRNNTKPVRLVFRVGHVPVYVESLVHPALQLDAWADVPFSLNVTTRGTGRYGFEYDADNGRLSQVEEVSPPQSSADFAAPISDGLSPTAKLEVAPGLNMKTTMWRTFGANIGASLPLGLTLKDFACTSYSNVELPTGDVFVEKPVKSGAEKKFFTFSPSRNVHEKQWDCVQKPAQEGDTDIPVDLKRQMMSMQVPAICLHKAGRMVDGRLEEAAINFPDGFVSLLTQGSEPLPENVKAKWIDIDSDGVNEIALVMQCYAGGLEWPESIFILDQNLNFIGVGSQSNGMNLPGEYHPTRAPFSKFETKGSVLHLEYGTYAPGESPCCGSLVAEGIFKVEGQKLVPVEPVKVRQFTLVPVED